MDNIAMNDNCLFDIELFQKAVQEELDKIRVLDNKLHCSILLYSLMEGVARYALPKINKNGERFTRLIFDYSHWEGANRICLSKLQQDLIKQKKVHIIQPCYHI